MKITPAIRTAIETSEGKALATQGSAGLNVVPVSMARVVDDTVWLFDFFMNKTIENLESNEHAALSVWKELFGIQIKGDVTIHRAGTIFKEGVGWVQEQNPDRVTRGVLVLTPTSAFDISAGPEAGKEIL